MTNKIWLLFILSLHLNIALSQDSIHTEITRILKSTVDEGYCVGIAAGYYIMGKKKWSTANGLLDELSGKPYTTQSVNRTASISKPMTAIAIMQLVEREQIGLNDKLGQFLPEFSKGQKSNITIRHLLQHSSGIKHYKGKKEITNNKHYTNLQAAVDLFSSRTIKFDPGTDFLYSTYGYTVLGRVIEVVSNMTYSDYMHKNIFLVARMDNTCIEARMPNIANKAAIYHQDKPGKIKLKSSNISDRVPGGGIQSTTDDLLKLGEAILSNTLISKESLALMTTDYGLKKEGSGYGFGFYLYGENPKHGNVFGHNGGQYGCTSFMMILPDEKAAVVVLSNTSGMMKRVSNIIVNMFHMVLE